MVYNFQMRKGGKIDVKIFQGNLEKGKKGERNRHKIKEIKAQKKMAHLIQIHQK
jgi:hypothetical protein